MQVEGHQDQYAPQIVVSDASKEREERIPEGGALKATQRLRCSKVKLGVLGLVGLGLLAFAVTMLTGIVNLTEEEQLLLIDPDGRSVRNGPANTWVQPGKKYEIRENLLLAQTQYAVISNVKDGLSSIRKGPGRFFLGAYEILVDVKAATSLTTREYLTVTDELTGQSRIVKGPQLFFPNSANEGVDGKEEAVSLTRKEYLYVTDTLTGHVQLVQGPRLYFPQHPHEKIDSKREIPELAGYETMITRSRNGSISYYDGSQGIAQVPLDYGSEIVEFRWSLGGDLEENNTRVISNKIDTRKQQLQFWFDDIRSRDNMEFELEGVIFWQVVDVKKLFHSTENPTSDIWHRLRSRIAEASTSYSFLYLLENASRVKDAVIAHELANHSDFYRSRGVTLLSMDLLEVELHSDDLAKKITDQVAQEATMRLNTIEQTITENELEITKMRGEHERKIQNEKNDLALEQQKAEKALAQKANEAKLAEVEQKNKAERAMRAASSELALKEREQNNSHILRQQKADNELIQKVNEAKLAQLEQENKAASAMRAASNALALKEKEQTNSHQLEITSIASQKQIQAQRSELLDLMATNSRIEASTAGTVAGVQLGKNVEEYLMTLNKSMPNLTDRVRLYELHQEAESRRVVTANLASGKAHMFLTPENTHLNFGSPFGSPLGKTEL